jgi:hypothetical protein
LRRRRDDIRCLIDDDGRPLALTRSDFNRAFDTRSGQHRRPHVNGTNGPADRRRNELRRDARINREARPAAATAAFVEDDGAIDHDGFANDHVALTRRQDYNGKTRR